MTDGRSEWETVSLVCAPWVSERASEQRSSPNDVMYDLTKANDRLRYGRLMRAFVHRGGGEGLKAPAVGS